MNDKELLRALIEESLISEELSQQITVEASQESKSAEQILYDKNLLDEESVAKAKSKILSIPYKALKPGEILEETLKLIPEETASSYKVVPLELKDKTLIVGMVEPWDNKAQEALRFIAKQKGLNLGVYVITPNDLERVLSRYSPYHTEIERAIKSLNIKPGESVAESLRPVSIDAEAKNLAEEAPIIRIVSSTLKSAVESRASDIHIEPQRNRVRVRFRVDGILKEVASFPSELQQPIASRIKILSNLKIDENRIPQDGRFRTVIFGRDIDFRVATFPTPVGEKVVLRVLDPSIGLRDVKDLGLVGPTEKITEDAIKRPFGMILITGPTGSGKTTTMYALLQTINNEATNVVSLEDPVEYFIDGVSQSQVKPEIGYTFASGLRQILRQDPDVIMVGEVRDKETAGLAVHAALTGHVVLATLHTNNSIGVIPRLIDMEVDPFLLPPALNAMISQRLVRKICQKCKSETQAPPAIQKIIKENIDALPDTMSEKKEFKEPYSIYKSEGCKECNGKGFLGRLALFEGFSMTRELEEIINSNPTEGKIEDEAKRQHMVTLRQDGILKALKGLVSIEDVIRETSEF